MRKEGLARELVNRIQNLRKSAGFEITDKIHIRLSSATNEMNDAIRDFTDYIRKQVLAETIEITENTTDGVVLDFEDFCLTACIEKVINN